MQPLWVQTLGSLPGPVTSFLLNQWVRMMETALLVLEDGVWLGFVELCQEAKAAASRSGFL